MIPGQRPLSNRAELEALRDMLAGVRDAIAAEITLGKTRQEVVAAKPTARFDAEWGKRFLDPEVFTQIVYSDLSRQEQPRE